jgi:hypothetical protein
MSNDQACRAIIGMVVGVFGFGIANLQIGRRFIAALAAVARRVS